MPITPRIFAKRFTPRETIDAGFAVATFAAGTLGTLLLLDAHDALGIYAAVISFALRIAHVRYIGYVVGPSSAK